MSQSPERAKKSARKPPRRPSSRGVARRGEVMSAAEDLFLEQGYESTTMEAIAARAGASKATFYKHFGSKEALFAEIVRSRVPEITGISGESLRDEGNPRTVLVEWGLRILERVTAPRAVALYKLILSERPRSPELGRIFNEQGPAVVHRQLVAFVRSATRRRKLACWDPEHAAVLLSSLIFADSFGWAIVGQDSSATSARQARVHVEEAVAVFLTRYGA
jgi:TetR/AcrR family transcriptional regulator, mexJK operon transcriptional repressor